LIRWWAFSRGNEFLKEIDMPLFDVDYGSAGSGTPDITWQSMPVRLRREIHWAWLKALIAPTKWLYNIFKTNRTRNLYILAHNSQVCFLEAVLNDTFDPVGRGIYISDGPFFDPDFIYRDDEDKPLFIDLDSEIGSHIIPDPDPVPLYTDDEVFSLSSFSFIINIPVAVVFDPDRLGALVNFYKLASKMYTYVTY
jgi:hypothetical protein